MVVPDERGTPIGNATVELMNLSTGLRWWVESGPSGRYFLEYLPVGGPYRLVARAIGFMPETRDGFMLALGQRHRTDIALVPEAYRLTELSVEGDMMALDWLVASRWLVASGDTTQAARLLTWHQAIDFSRLGPVLAPLAYGELARIEDARGQAAWARRNYQQCLRRYDRPTSRLRPLVGEAERALACLSQQPTGKNG